MVRLMRIGQRIGTMRAKVQPMPKVADRFYLSREWLALRERRMLDPDYHAAKARAGPGERLVLDHIVERKDGGADLDPANTAWLTYSEHQAKTARAKRARAYRRGGGRKSTA